MLEIILNINNCVSYYNLSHLPTLDSSCLAGEVDAELDNCSLIHCERSGIVFRFYLLQNYRGVGAS